MEDLRTNAELLSVALGYDERITGQIMKVNRNSFSNLFRRCEEELVTYNGVGNKFVEKMSAMKEIARRRYLEDAPQKQFLSAVSVYQMMMPTMANLVREEFWVLVLNSKSCLIKKVRLFTGGTNGVIVDVRCVLKEILLNNGVCVIVCHNHPSNSLKPSKEDDMITEELRKGCNALKIRLIDHVIVCENNYYSYHEQGKI